MNRLILFSLLIFFSPLHADELRVAVASNFSPAMQQIARRFEQQSGHHVKISSGATGRHYAQIRQGAPFDVFFAADSRRPALLEQQGLGKNRFTYALGKLVPWSPDPALVDSAGRVLQSDRFHFLAIANPKLAPYGRAARQVLERLGLWRVLRARMVRGENIGHAFQFVNSGNAQLGFVAAAQVMRPNHQPTGSWWQVPDAYYDEIQQQAVSLNGKKVSQAFMDFVRSDDIQRLIRQSGYRTAGRRSK